MDHYNRKMLGLFNQIYYLQRNYFFICTANKLRHKKLKVTWQYVNNLEVELSYYRLKTKNKSKYVSKITDKVKKRHNNNH